MSVEQPTADAPPDDTPIVLLCHLTAKHGGFPTYAWGDPAPGHAAALRKLHERHRRQHEGLPTDFPPAPGSVDHDHRGDELWAFGSRELLPSTWLKECSALAATWCPVHGDCKCNHPSHLEVGDRWLESANPKCPLHSPSSDHPRKKRHG